MRAVFTEEYKKWWLYYVKSKTPEGYFHLPLDAKRIDDMTPEEFELLDSSQWEMITDNPYGITYFLCKNIEE